MSITNTVSSNSQLDARRLAATPRGIGVGFSIYAEKARNAELWDVQGQRYIDFAAGIAVLNTGHCHPRVVAAMQAQLQQFTHTCYQVVPYASAIALAERINAITPGSHAKKTAFFTTGAEAVENAIKIARAHTRRPGVIALAGGFHGRTLLGMTLTGKTVPYKLGFGPLPPSIYHMQTPNALHGVSVDQALQSLQHIFKSDIEPSQVAAIIVEPVQGEGGFYVLPPAFLRTLRQICDEHGILLIADEVQTGFARTGRLFAMEHSGVIPDLMALAKSLAGGVPLSAVCGRAEIMDAPAPGGLGGTYAANPLAVAAALAVLDIIESESLCARAQTIGQVVRTYAEQLQQQSARIADVRGLGAMMAVEFCHPDTKAPDAQFAKLVQTRARDLGLLLLVCGVHSNVIRFLCPLTIEEAVLKEGLDIFRQAVLA